MLDRQPLDDINQLLRALSGDVVGRSLHFDLVRGGGLVPVDVLIGERPRTRP
jgi:hypothetical protein